MLTAEHYGDAGLLGPISSQKWVQSWARARAGTSGGESELHATLIKAAVKKVCAQTGPDGRSKNVAEGLRQLVNAAKL